MTDANPAYALFERAVNKRRLSNRIAAVVVTLMQAVALLRQVATEATEGFSEERRVKFRAQPESLRKTTGAGS